MHVAELLESKGRDVYWTDPLTPLQHVIDQLARRNIGSVVISHDGVSVDGIASERDVVRALDRRGPEIVNDPVHLIMSFPVATCESADDVESVMEVMTKLRVRHLPVVDGGNLCGIISIGDVVKARLRQLEQDREDLIRYIEAR